MSIYKVFHIIIFKSNFTFVNIFKLGTLSDAFTLDYKLKQIHRWIIVFKYIYNATGNNFIECIKL